MNERVLKYIQDNWQYTTHPAAADIPLAYSSPCKNAFYSDFFYWDTYFINKGLLLSGMYEQAMNNAKNIAFFIEKYGYMPNSNVLTDRSQPPFFTLIVEDLYQHSKNPGIIKSFLDSMIREHRFFEEKRMTDIGLNAYGCETSDRDLLNDYEVISMRLQEDPKAEEEKLLLCRNFYAVAESGLDFNMRFRTEKSKLNADAFAHLDLNCILYAVECAISRMSRIIGEQACAEQFAKRAEDRKTLMFRYFFDKKEGIFLDYNLLTGHHSHTVTAVSLYPHCFGVTDDAASAEKVLSLLELPCGIAAAADRGEDVYYQWDYPVLWGETTLLAYTALKNCKMDADAERIKQKYMETVEKQFENTNELWEKYDARDGSVMNAEYNAPPFMGWTAAAYQIFAEQESGEQSR